MLTRNDLRPPFYANIFSYRASNSRDGYDEADEATLTAVRDVDGFLGYEVTGDGKRRIFISYWRDLDAIDTWRRNRIHQHAKSHGKAWYDAYHSMVVKVESHSLWNPDLL